MSKISVNSELYDTGELPAHTSLLQFLRETAGLTGTKEGCASGDCGACTVIVRSADGSNAHNINSCIAPVGAASGKQVITIEGVGTPDAMHPVQQAMVEQHGSQCGFCTPGFVMSMVAAQLRAPSVAGLNQRSAAIEAVSGNLCRCTGYRPILDAALQANQEVARASTPALPRASAQPYAASQNYARPRTLAEFWQRLGKSGFTSTLVDQPTSDCWLVSGATDAFLEVTQRYLDPVAIVDISEIEELRGIQVADGERRELTLGAATTHAEAMRWFAEPGPFYSPAIVSVLQRFGSPQIRARGTLGGNIANASPIADWPPLLLALNADVTLVDVQGQRRRLPLTDFFLDYKQTALATNELLLSIHVPANNHLPTENAFADLSAHKISKRFEDDISTTMGSLYLREQDGTVQQCRIGFGGVAATPLRCRKTEAVITGQPLTLELIDAAVATLAEDIMPISDVRSSAEYRHAASAAVLRNLLLERFGSTPA